MDFELNIKSAKKKFKKLIKCSKERAYFASCQNKPP